MLIWPFGSHWHSQAQVLGVLRHRGPLKGAGGEPCSDASWFPLIKVVKGWSGGWKGVVLKGSSAVGCQELGVLHSTPKVKNVLDNPILPRGENLGGES